MGELQLEGVNVDAGVDIVVDAEVDALEGELEGELGALLKNYVIRLNCRMKCFGIVLDSFGRGTTGTSLEIFKK